MNNGKRRSGSGDWQFASSPECSTVVVVLATLWHAQAENVINGCAQRETNTHCGAGIWTGHNYLRGKKQCESTPVRRRIVLVGLVQVAAKEATNIHCVEGTGRTDETKHAQSKTSVRVKGEKKTLSSSCTVSTNCTQSHTLTQKVCPCSMERAIACKLRAIFVEFTKITQKTTTSNTFFSRGNTLVHVVLPLTP